MNPWIGMPRLTQADAERRNIAALHFGAPYAVSVGVRRYVLQFDACRQRYPLRLAGSASGHPFALDCDARALLPELPAHPLPRDDAAARAMIEDALEDWLSALEGAFGFSFELHSVSFDSVPPAGAYGLSLMHPQSGRTAHFSFQCEAVDQWLRRRRTPSSHGIDDLSRRLRVPVQLCMAAPSLSLSRLRKIRPGDALLLDRASYHLRVPLRHGARRILLNLSGEHILVDRPMIDDDRDQPEMTSEFIAIDALTFAFDAVLGTVSLSVHELAHLRTGSILSLQIPVRERAVTLLCQGVPFGRGELIDIDDALGVRITDMTHAASPDANA
ncbi:MAG TPA: FliM/FliN family flagellar motor switch protein [Paraburkholderia sp.]